MKKFINKKKAEECKNYWDNQAKKQDVNLKHHILKKGKIYVVRAETKRN